MLFDSIIYGPIHSRRLGVSLGINLMPTDAKLCTFNCVYCECGWNQPVQHPQLPTRAEVAAALEAKLQELSSLSPIKGENLPDVLTFSGNGEPTLHPDFLGIIQDTCRLRDLYCPQAKISVLSNSTQLHRPDVVNALRLVDNRILKLDAALDDEMRRIDLPVNSQLTVQQIIQQLSVFDGDFILQTCFLRSSDGLIDNTRPHYLQAWYEAVEHLHPRQIMIYVIDRKTPQDNLQKISRDEMEAIAAPLRNAGYDVSISA